MRTGDVGLVLFKFMYNSEYVRVGDIVILREGRTKLQGKVTQIFYHKNKSEILLNNQQEN